MYLYAYIQYSISHACSQSVVYIFYTKYIVFVLGNHFQNKCTKMTQYCLVGIKWVMCIAAKEGPKIRLANVLPLCFRRDLNAELQPAFLVHVPDDTVYLHLSTFASSTSNSLIHLLVDSANIYGVASNICIIPFGMWNTSKYLISPKGADLRAQHICGQQPTLIHDDNFCFLVKSFLLFSF